MPYRYQCQSLIPQDTPVGGFLPWQFAIDFLDGSIGELATYRSPVFASGWQVDFDWRYVPQADLGSWTIFVPTVARDGVLRWTRDPNKSELGFKNWVRFPLNRVTFGFSDVFDNWIVLGPGPFPLGEVPYRMDKIEFDQAVEVIDFDNPFPL